VRGMPVGWLRTGLIAGGASFAALLALTVVATLTRQSVCGPAQSYFPAADLVLGIIVVLSGVAGWWTVRAGGTIREAALAGLVTGAIMGLVPFVFLVWTPQSAPIRCPQGPFSVGSNYASITLASSVGFLVETALLGVIVGLTGGRQRLRRNRRV
jgi:hypothetical protein